MATFSVDQLIILLNLGFTMRPFVMFMNGFQSKASRPRILGEFAKLFVTSIGYHRTVGTFHNTVLSFGYDRLSVETMLFRRGSFWWMQASGSDVF